MKRHSQAHPVQLAGRWEGQGLVPLGSVISQTVARVQRDNLRLGRRFTIVPSAAFPIVGALAAVDALAHLIG
jgi:hypothetical protein